jgi:hypothetical protein
VVIANCTPKKQKNKTEPEKLKVTPDNQIKTHNNIMNHKLFQLNSIKFSILTIKVMKTHKMI